MDIKQSSNILDAENEVLEKLRQKLREYNVNKPMNPELVERLIVTRFHSCLYRLKYASENGAFANMSDEDLVKTHCIKDRLTLYNFLVRRKAMNREAAKKLISKEYVFYLRGEDREANIYDKEKNIDDYFIFEYK